MVKLDISKLKLSPAGFTKLIAPMKGKKHGAKHIILKDKNPTINRVQAPATGPKKK